MPDPTSYVTDSTGGPPRYPEPTEAEYQAMAALIIAQPELNGVVHYTALRAALNAYEQWRDKP